MDITPSPEFCAACRVILGGDTPDIVIPALRTTLRSDIQRVYDDIVAGRRVVVFPLDPPAGTQPPLPHMLLEVQKAAAEQPDDEDDPDRD
ncbi:MAG: hypothetical protein WB766_10085 [Roseiarcus sp.]